MLSSSLNVGQLVEASCGRDQGKLFFIVSIIDKDHVLISDGKHRKLDKPKLKKIKHLKVFNFVDEEVKTLLQRGEDITDSFLRARLYKLK